jgi:hypothetical protein
MSERPQFKGVAADFIWDGTLRDIYVLDTDTADWDHLGSVLGASGLTLTFLLDGLPAPLPASLANHVADPHHAPLLLVRLTDDFSVRCNFFTPGEIEFDFDPRCVQDQNNWETLLDFIARVGDGLGKPVLLTPENHCGSPIMSYEPRSKSWAHNP